MTDLKLDKDVIGPGYWFLHHYSAAESRNRDQRDNVLFFIDLTRHYFFCLNCRSHYDLTCIQFPPENYSSNNVSLFEWTYHAHSKSKEDIHTQITKNISLDQAKNIYLTNKKYPSQYPQELSSDNIEHGIWYALFLISLHVETPKEKNTFFWFLHIIGKILPIIKSTIEEIKLENELYFDWMVRIYNKVNVKLSREQIDIEVLRKLYTNSCEDCLSKNKI